MKLLLDQGLPRSAAAALRTDGIDAVHVGDVGMASAEDADILERGRLEQRVVITLDADFHQLLAFSSARFPSVVRIRIEGLRGAALAALIQKVIDECGEELELGAMVTVQESRIRGRRLPLTSA